MRSSALYFESKGPLETLSLCATGGGEALDSRRAVASALVAQHLFLALCEDLSQDRLAATARDAGKGRASCSTFTPCRVAVLIRSWRGP